MNNINANNSIEQALNIAPMHIEDDVISTTPQVIEHVSDDEERANNDFKYARENFYNVIESGTKALEDMLDVAKASEHPRAYEVVSTLMKTLVDANKDLVAMSEKKAGPKKEENSPEGTVNNNLFVGSTAELQAMLRDLKNE